LNDKFISTIKIYGNNYQAISTYHYTGEQYVRRKSI